MPHLQPTSSRSKTQSSTQEASYLSLTFKGFSDPGFRLLKPPENKRTKQTTKNKLNQISFGLRLSQPRAAL